MATADLIRTAVKSLDPSALRGEVQHHIDDHFADLDVLTGHTSPASGNHAGPSKLSHLSLERTASRRGKKRRGLNEEIAYWENRAAAADNELAETSAELPGALQSAQERLSTLLRSAQDLSLQRYALADKLSTLVSELDSSVAADGEYIPETERQGKSVLEQLESVQGELGRLEAGLAWVTVLENVVSLSEKVLDPKSHDPTPLAALPEYTNLHNLVDRMSRKLPAGTSLLRIIIDIRDRTWAALKDIMSNKLLSALEPLKWPVKVDYPAVPAAQRRAFERAYQDLLFLQSEGENLGVGAGRLARWYDGDGLYPLQAMVQPIALRFKYHFQGSRNTNRVDKPEWAFTNIVDRIYELQGFIDEYLAPLTHKAGYEGVDVKSEFTMLLFPILLGMLRSRIPHLLDTPALLAHTIYQTVVFDDTIRENGFDIDAVSINEGVQDVPPWEGLAGLVLREQNWFDRWLAGEKKFAEEQLHEIISSADAWNLSDETQEEDGPIEEDVRPTTSARQVKALIEQITDRYAPLPSLAHRLPFLVTIQLPLISTYLSRISGSLDAFETLSSAFVRAVPGALAGNTRSGAHFDQTRLTGGKAGLERLIKANLSSGWILSALRSWADDSFFVEMSSDLAGDEPLRLTVSNELSLPAALRNGDGGAHASIFDVAIGRYEALVKRTEDMMIRHVSVEVENELKPHLTSRWDREEGQGGVPDSSLLQALTTYSSLLSTLSLLPPLATSRIYRGVVSHLANHISQRAVYAGWSKFSYQGGKDFQEEIKDWISTSSSAVGSVLIGGESGVDAPWSRLREIAVVLSLPSQAEGEDVSFAQGMAAAWSEGTESLQAFEKRAGVRLDQEALRGILRRRVECWR